MTCHSGDGRWPWQELKEKILEPFLYLTRRSCRTATTSSSAGQRRAREPDGTELEDSRESRLGGASFDNSRSRSDSPKVTLSAQGDRRFGAADAVGASRARVCRRRQRVRPLLPDDGVLDGTGESFTLRLPELSLGHTTVTVRVQTSRERWTGEAQFTIKVDRLDGDHDDADAPDCAERPAIVADRLPETAGADRSPSVLWVVGALLPAIVLMGPAPTCVMNNPEARKLGALVGESVRAGSRPPGRRDGRAASSRCDDAMVMGPCVTS